MFQRTNSSANENKRAAEDKLSIIFLGIVIFFLICHVPRIFLALQEAYTIRNSMACRNAGQNSFPFWSLVLSIFNHILLVLNSSLNSAIYCIFSSKYRAKALKHWNSVKSSFSQP